MTRIFSDTPDLIIKAPPGFERDQKLPTCPLCDRPFPRVDFYLPVAGATLVTYTCLDDNGMLNHSFSAHQETFKDADNLKIFKAPIPSNTIMICDKCNAVYPNHIMHCTRCSGGRLREENKDVTNMR